MPRPVGRPKGKSFPIDYDTPRFYRALSKSKEAAQRFGWKPCTATAEELKAAFTGKCHNPLCGVSESELKRKLSMDHDHVTGAFRGWLCDSCNMALGSAKDNPVRLAGLVRYLTEITN